MTHALRLNFQMASFIVDLLTTLNIAKFSWMRWLDRHVRDSLFNVQSWYLFLNTSKVAVRIHERETRHAWRPCCHSQQLSLSFDIKSSLSDRFPCIGIKLRCSFVRTQVFFDNDIFLLHLGCVICLLDVLLDELHPSLTFRHTLSFVLLIFFKVCSLVKARIHGTLAPDVSQSRSLRVESLNIRSIAEELGDHEGHETDNQDKHND